MRHFLYRRGVGFNADDSLRTAKKEMEWMGGILVNIYLSSNWDCGNYTHLFLTGSFVI